MISWGVNRRDEGVQYYISIILTLEKPSDHFDPKYSPQEGPFDHYVKSGGTSRLVSQND